MEDVMRTSSSNESEEVVATSSDKSSICAALDGITPSVEAESSDEVLAFSTTPNPQKCQLPCATDYFQLRFLDFPDLVRFEIYEPLLFARRRGGYGTDLTIRSGRVERLRLLPEILRANRQIHDEAVSVLYGRNVFHADTTDGFGPFQYE